MAALLLFLAISVLKAEVTYQFEKGMTLIYELELETEIHFDARNRDRFIPFHSQYEIRIHVFDTMPKGEACLAMASTLSSAQLVEGSENIADMDEKDLDAYRKWTADFTKTGSAAVVLDRYGNIVRGRMPWPEATCYNLPKILEGLSLRGKKSGSPLGGRFLIDNQVTDTENHDGKTYTILRTQNRLLDLALRFDNNSRLPLRVQAKYAYKTFGSVFMEHLTLRLGEVFSNQNWDDFLSDVSMMSAIIQAAQLTQSYNLEPEFVQKALLSENPLLRRAAASYCSVSDVVKDFGFMKEEKDKIVKLNIAKAVYRWKKDHTQLEYLSKKGKHEIKKRAQSFLTQKRENQEKYISSTLESLSNLMPELSEREAYQAARSIFSKKKMKIPHLGPRSFGLATGVSGNRIFHYSVYVPLDYDPEELYPCLIEFSGGNGFSESVFL